MNLYEHCLGLTPAKAGDALLPGTQVNVLKCPQCPWAVAQVAEVVKHTSPCMVQVRFFDGYQRIIRVQWLSVVSS